LGRLRVLSGKQVCALLAEHGFVAVRQRGRHIVMQKRAGHSTITVPVPNHREIAVGTLLAIIRQSQVPRSVFEAD
jgi:predicted RNA binding protein YcfA (HicA-like mRNA interferase family)